MQDLNSLLPHSKKDAKLDSKSKLEDINEIAELNNCNNCLYFETRKHQDMYMWMSKTPNGPSAKFSVKNVHTMDELKLTGNCLKGSRPILSFDANFDSEPYLQLLKEMFTQTYSVPTTSRKTKPFIDHVMSFSVLDNKIWIRNYQIIEAVDVETVADEGEPKTKKTKTSSVPALVLSWNSFVYLTALLLALLFMKTHTLSLQTMLDVSSRVRLLLNMPDALTAR